MLRHYQTRWNVVNTLRKYISSTLYIICFLCYYTNFFFSVTMFCCFNNFDYAEFYSDCYRSCSWSGCWKNRRQRNGGNFSSYTCFYYLPLFCIFYVVKLISTHKWIHFLASYNIQHTIYTKKVVTMLLLLFPLNLCELECSYDFKIILFCYEVVVNLLGLVDVWTLLRKIYYLRYGWDNGKEGWKGIWRGISVLAEHKQHQSKDEHKSHCLKQKQAAFMLLFLLFFDFFLFLFTFWLMMMMKLWDKIN